MQDENKSTMLAVIAVVVVIIIGIVIFLLAQNNANPSVINNTTNPSPVSSPTIETTKSFVLTQQNGSGQDGTVTLEENGNSTKVTITLSNTTSVAQPAHIHIGKCPTPAEVKYSLTNVVNGISITNINAKFADLKMLGELAVNVHKSAEESNIYVSCGDLVL